MPPTPRTPTPNRTPTPQQVSAHRQQVRRVMASLRSGVRYERPGRVAKDPAPRR
jgi:hypothetical protein